MDDVFDKPRPPGITRHAPRIVGGFALAAALAGCGSAAPTREKSLNEAFARIQVHEARIETERAALADAGARCARRCRAASAVCGEGARICAIARDVADADALARCGRAGDTCEAARGDARARCGRDDAKRRTPPGLTSE